MKPSTGVLLLALAAMCASRPARAQVVTEPGAKGWVPPPANEPRFRAAPAPIFGLDIGLGVLQGTCERCPLLGGVTVAAFAGLHVHKRVSLLVDARSTVHPLPTIDELTEGILLNTSYALAAQVWITPHFWLRGGGGLTLQNFIIDGPDELRFGPTAVVGVGSEQRHQPDSGVDLVLHVAMTALETDPDRRGLLVVVTPAISGHWH